MEARQQLTLLSKEGLPCTQMNSYTFQTNFFNQKNTNDPLRHCHYIPKIKIP